MPHTNPPATAPSATTTAPAPATAPAALAPDPALALPAPATSPIRGCQPDTQHSFQGTSGPPTVFAVYGTLMEGQPNARVVDGLGQYGERVEIVGADLFNLGGCPGLRPGDGTVKAQLWRAAPGREVEALARLDALEGCRGDTGMYVRRPMALADGRTVTVYVWNHSTDGRPLVPDGDWRTAVAAWQGWH